MVVKLTIFDKPNVVFYFDSENIFSQNNQTRSNECRDQISKLDIDEKRSFISMYVQVRSKILVPFPGQCLNRIPGFSEFNLDIFRTKI